MASSFSLGFLELVAGESLSCDFRWPGSICNPYSPRFIKMDVEWVLGFRVPAT